MYLSNLNFLCLVFKPVYDLKVPFTNRDAIENINKVQNILASVKTAALIEQITGQDFQEMTIKFIQTTSWKHLLISSIEMLIAKLLISSRSNTS